ncbi:MAG TPA: GNAT family protein [Rhodothermia bacterium]|nr:GNAT family protein [Rhodothermia bacterium]
MSVGASQERAITDGEQLIGQRVYLRLLEMSDCGDRYLGWLLDPQINRFLETRWTEQSHATIESFVSEMRTSPDNYLFAIVDIESERHIGNIKLGPVNRIHGHCDVGYFIGDREMWGRGSATEAIRLATKFAFERLRLHRVQAVVDVDNPASAKALERVGYRKEATLREKLFMDGRWNDQFLYGILQPELRTP